MSDLASLSARSRSAALASDMEAFMTHINSPETQAAKAEDGVIDKGLRFYAEAK